MNKLTLIPLLTSALLLSACSSDSENSTTNDTARWYSSEHVTQGQTIFTQNCAVCHGSKAQGLANNIKLSVAGGTSPAPALNGSAHAWHHSLSTLKRTIQNGGIALGGTMPGFKDKLSESDQLSVIAYIQSLWPDTTYQAWLQRDGLK